MKRQPARRTLSVIAGIALILAMLTIPSAAQAPAPSGAGPDEPIGRQDAPLSTAGERAGDVRDIPTTYIRTGGEIIISALDNQQYLPSVAYNWKQREYLVVWYNKWGASRDIYARRVSNRGELLSGFTIASGPNDHAQPSVAYDPVHDQYLVVWIYDVNGDGSNWDILGRFITWQGPEASMQEFPICTWSTNQWNPRIAYGRAVEEFMVAWTNEYASGVLPKYVSAARVNAGAGNVVDIYTIDSDPAQHRFNPDIAYNLARNEYLIVWEAQGSSADIFGVRLTGSGATLGGGKFGIAGWPSHEERPAVAACSASDTYYVAWQSYVGPDNYDVYGRIVAGNGTVGAVHHFDYTSIHETNPEVDCNYNSTEFLVVFEGQYSSTVGPFGIFGQTVTQAGLGAPFTIRDIAIGENTNCTNPVVAGGGTNYLTVWEHDRPGTAFQDIHGRLSVTHSVFLPGMER
jgi:hypothetical protein